MRFGRIVEEVLVRHEITTAYRHLLRNHGIQPSLCASSNKPRAPEPARSLVCLYSQRVFYLGGT